MDKILLSTKDIDFILKWRDEHRDLVRMGVAPLKAVKIICFESGFIITAIRNETSLKFSVSRNGKSIGSINFTLMDNGLCQLTKNNTKLSEEDRQTVLTVYCSTMALLAFGKDTLPVKIENINSNNKINSTNSNAYKNNSKKKKSNSFTYILHTNNKGEIQLKAKGTHNSPQGEFGVRGHYRHYKDGKVVWIPQYVKGKGKTHKDKTYKLAVTK